MNEIAYRKRIYDARAATTRPPRRGDDRRFAKPCESERALGLPCAVMNPVARDQPPAPGIERPSAADSPDDRHRLEDRFTRTPASHPVSGHALAAGQHAPNTLTCKSSDESAPLRRNHVDDLTNLLERTPKSELRGINSLARELEAGAGPRLLDTSGAWSAEGGAIAVLLTLAGRAGDR